jgi:glycosyltransferase involved in cell wall biosynthesis
MDITLVTPVHNEGESIYATIEEFFNFYKTSEIKINFIISEDGSSDNSVEQIELLQDSFSVELLSEPLRKGYSRAVIDGLKMVDSDVISFIDSDGQCDPADLTNLLEKFDGNNLVIGNRANRNDSSVRKMMSASFKFVYEILFSTNLKDPSCPYFITSAQNLTKILNTPSLGVLKQGFWWEFYARAKSLNIEILQVDINHRKRAAGNTVVYRPTKLPRIVIEHLIGLFKLKKLL